MSHWAASLVSLGLLTACGNPTDNAKPASEPARPVVIAVNYPLLAMAEAIGGEDFAVALPALDGDPAFWRPAAATILRYQDADLILRNGADYAKWMQTASLPSAKLVDTSAGFHAQLIDVAGPTHRHGPNAAHSHAGTAFTTWLDMQQAIAQASAIHDALLTLRPERRAAMKRRFAALRAQLQDFDQRLHAIGHDLADAPLLYSHPIYQYLQRAYGLNGRALTWEPDAMPDQRQWRELDALLAQQPSRLMLWESEPLAATRERLAALGVATVVFSPVANRPPSGDFLSIMQSNIAALGAWLENRPTQ